MGRTKGKRRAPDARLSWRSALAWRMRRHQLDRRAPRRALLDVTARIGGLHAQLMRSAELALWNRVSDLLPSTVGRALFRRRTLVKTWAMRGTLHLLPARELPLWQAALDTYAHYRRPSWLRAVGLTARELERMLEAVAVVLDGRLLTREQLADEVARRARLPKLRRKLRDGWGALLKPAAFRGDLCFAPDLDGRVRFTRPDGWVRAWREVDPDQALLEVTRRFLGAHGPATCEDHARWWDKNPRTSARLFERLGDEVLLVDVEGTEAFLLARDLKEAAAAEPPGEARLLPAFDPWVVGASRDVPQVLPAAHRARVHRPQGWISPVLLVDGRIAGVWSQEREGETLAVRVEPFGRLPGWVRPAVTEEAERLADHLDAPLEIRFGRPGRARAGSR